MIKITILKGEEATTWKQGRRKLLKEALKGCQIDGIDDKRRYMYQWTAVLNPKFNEWDF